MGWNFTDDPEHYADRVTGLLAQRPAANTIALTVLDLLRAGQRLGPGELVLAWYERDGEVVGAVSITPPYGILLTVVPGGSEVELVDGLRERRTAVPDVSGTIADVERFVRCWSAGRRVDTELIVRQRLYQLDRLVPPEPSPSGSARPATAEDQDLVLQWLGDFQQEAERTAVKPDRAQYVRRIQLGLIWLWLDEREAPVSLAGRNVTIAGMSRVGPVFTPPRFRRTGYGAAVTAACTQDAVDRGAEVVVLFTDLSNPTSNGVYQRLGYQPVEDRLILRFAPSSDPR